MESMMLLAQGFPGMQYIPLIFLALGIGYVMGLASVLSALLRRRGFAQKMSIGVIAFAMVTTGIFFMLLGDEVHWLAYAITISPAALGFVAFAIAWFTRNLQPLGFKASIVVSALFLGTIVGGVVSLAVANHVPYYQDRDRLLSDFQAMNQLSGVVIEGFEWEGIWCLDTVRFSIPGKPHSLVVFSPGNEYVRYEYDTPLDTCMLYQIGPCRFREFRKYASGEAFSELDAIYVGPRGAYQKLVPFEINSIRDIVEHYDELVTFFENEWPSKESPGELDVGESRDPLTINYWREIERPIPAPEDAVPERVDGFYRPNG